jgi:hypothetical protein
LGLAKNTRGHHRSKTSLPTWKVIAKKGLSTFTGAVTNGEYGAAAIELKSVHDKLEACKSWFFFDQEYVCLGAAIRSEEDFRVATTLNQCLLNGAVVVKTKTGREVPGWGQHSFKEINWVLHDSVGYLFSYTRFSEHKQYHSQWQLETNIPPVISNRRVGAKGCFYRMVRSRQATFVGKLCLHCSAGNNGKIVRSI